MATISEKSIIDQMLANGGRYESDPPPFAIFEYHTPEGATAWSVCYNVADAFRLLDSKEFVLEPRLIWPPKDEALAAKHRAMLDDLIRRSHALFSEQF